MSALDFNASEAILTACRANAAEVGGALGRCFGGDFEVVIPESATPIAESVLPGAEPGLVMVMKLAEGAAALFWPQSSGILPDWHRATDASTRAKLNTLAQEFGMLLLPESAAPVDFTSHAVRDLAGAWTRAAISSSGGIVDLCVKSGEKEGRLTLVWTATAPDQIPEAAPATPRMMPAFFSQEEQAAETFEESLANLPPYMRSLLRIKVKLTVSLARTRQPVRRIVELGPGSVIQFSKRCDEPLELCVDDQEIAVGEAVKVGEKFGVRLNSMVLPKERFVRLTK